MSNAKDNRQLFQKLERAGFIVELRGHGYRIRPPVGAEPLREHLPPILYVPCTTSDWRTVRNTRAWAKNYGYSPN